METPPMDIRVAVDFGTTYTGVSWDTPKEIPNPTNIINNWPGALGSENKVPTVLAKEGRDWGFLCNTLAEDKKWKLFKLFLDPNHYEEQKRYNADTAWIPAESTKVHDLVIEYLTQIYNHISEEIPRCIQADNTLKDELREKSKIWASMKVEFIFSTPTTWSPPTTQRFRSLVFGAGFGKEGSHNVVLGLTEAEAAAVFSCCWDKGVQILNNNVLLMVDAGGGTTDLAFVRKHNNSLALTEIRPVIGYGVGSIQIDRAFADLVETRINENRNFRDQLPPNFSLKASQSRGFQDWKVKYGVQDRDQTAGGDYCIRVDESQELTHHGMRIQKGDMTFEREKLEACFDETWSKMKANIQKALDGASDPGQGEPIQVDYIVLSGGLGSSEYIFKELKKHVNLQGGGNNGLSAATVLQAKGHAQTVVIQGLLEDRKDDVRALSEYIARANYGIAESPLSKVSTTSPNSSEREAIYWQVRYKDLIKVGQSKNIEITRKLGKKDERRWTEEIVWAISTKGSLPQNMKQANKRGVERLHRVYLSVDDRTKLKRVRKWWGPTAYYTCKFNLAMIVGPSGECVVKVVDNSLVLSER